MTMQRTIIALTLAGGLVAFGCPAFAQGHDTPQPPRQKWSFSGPFGKFDEALEWIESLLKAPSQAVKMPARKEFE